MLVTVRDVVKTYGQGEAAVSAVRGVSAEIGYKDFVAVCGPSGSGKTTLLSIMAGLNHPTEGEVIVDEISIYRQLGSESLADFRSEYVGFVFQSFHLIPYLSALENVMLPLAPKRLNAKKKRQMATHALERVSVPEKAAFLPGQLSGGQRQRVAIARAIVNDPPLLLADEPTGNLDTSTRDEILGLFRSLCDSGHTVIMVTHDPDNISTAERVLRIEDGRLHEPATVMG